MKFKGNLVITDPCYMKGQHSLMERNTIYGDWSCMVYNGNIEENKEPEKWDEVYFKFFHEYNFANKTEKEKKALLNEFRNFEKNWLNKNDVLGRFCADGGEVGIFDYDNLSEENKNWIKEHDWCACIINDFDGEIEFVVIDNKLHVIGKGNKNFFTVQSGF